MPLCTRRVLTFFEIIKAILMGIVEGITEWLPISSTGHMILLEQIIKFNASEEFMSMFRVVIQLGAIMAVVVLFWGKLWPFGMKQQSHFQAQRVEPVVQGGSGHDPGAHHQPAGRLDGSSLLQLHHGCRDAHSVWRAVLCCGEPPRAPHVSRLEQITYRDAIIIGLWQCLAIIPGTSRSGATIVGGLLLGLSRAVWQSSPSIWPSRSWRAHPCSRWSSSLSAVP